MREQPARRRAFELDVRSNEQKNIESVHLSAFFFWASASHYSANPHQTDKIEDKSNSSLHLGGLVCS